MVRVASAGLQWPALFPAGVAGSWARADIPGPLGQPVPAPASDAGAAL